MEEAIMYTEIQEHQSRAADIILQNWIATQTLAKDAPIFQINSI